MLENTQVYVNLSEETNLYLDRLWTEIMSAEAGYNYWSMPLFLIGALALSVAITVMKKTAAEDVNSLITKTHRITSKQKVPCFYRVLFYAAKREKMFW